MSRRGLVVKPALMNQSNSSQSSQQRALGALRRNQLLTEFDRSGLSAAAFARHHDIHYTTFCGWRQRRDKSMASPQFVQVDLPRPSTTDELIVELGHSATIRVGSLTQARLAAEVVRHLNAPALC